MAYLLNRENNPQSNTFMNYPKYTLFIYAGHCSQELQQIYKTNAIKHNDSVYHNIHPDSGFDILIPNEQFLSPNKSNKIDLFIKCEMVEHVDGTNIPSAFYMYPRSSISKTKFRLANSVGIIDSGYRGNLIAKLDNTGYHKTGIHARDFETQKGDKYVQICMPDLSPFTVILVDNIEALGTTERGDGGFGSTNHK